MSDEQTILEELWTSTIDLHVRFGNFPPDHAASLTKMEEECQEVCDAANALCAGPSGSSRSKAQIHLAEEIADTIVTMFGVMQAHGIPLAMLELVMSRVIEKNGQKDLETHKLNPDTKLIEKRKF